MTITRRDLLSGATFLAAGTLAQELLWSGPLSALASALDPRGSDPLRYVNPQFCAVAERMMNQIGSIPPLNAETLPTARQRMLKMAPPSLPKPTVKNQLIPGPAGAPPVRVFVVGDVPEGSKPAVLHIHGGGYVMGSAESNQRRIQELSTSLDCVVVSVEYRLAPETPFPGSLEDNYAALRWLYSNAKQLGVDPKRIAIKGESSGGGHAAALAVATRDRGEVPICLQVLIYPMLDDRTGSSRPVPPYLGHFIWTEQANQFGWSSLLGVPAGSSKVPPGSVPARIDNLDGLPPAFIGVGSIDLFCPEDIEYASRLVAAGISTELQLIPGAFHGFNEIVPEAPLSRQFEQAWLAALRRAFNVPNIQA